MKGNGKWIRKLRGKTTQTEYAKKMGITQPRLSKLEIGLTCPTLDIVHRLYKNCKVSPKRILDEYDKSIKSGEQE